jgi:hypothetical protein
MRNYFLLCIFLVGLFAIGCSSPPISKTVTSTSLSDQTAVQTAIQAPVIYAVDDVAPAVPPASNSPDVNLLTAGAGILIAIYELVVRLVPTSKSISALAFIYKILSAIVPDRSQKGGTFSIRDKL